HLQHGRRQEPPAPDPAAARDDDELPERVLPVPAHELAQRGAAEGGRQGCFRRGVPERALRRRRGARLPQGARARDPLRPPRAAGRRHPRRQGGIRRVGRPPRAPLDLPPLRRSRDPPRVKLTLLLAGAALLSAVPTSAQMVSGSYSGNGSAGRKITGLGFKPDLVMIKGDDQDTLVFSNTATILRTSTMAGDSS